MATVKPLHVACPECHEVIEVPLTLTVMPVTEVFSRDVNVTVDPDLSGVWLHAWTAHPETTT